MASRVTSPGLGLCIQAAVVVVVMRREDVGATAAALLDVAAALAPAGTQLPTRVVVAVVR
jgi:hypothetical protein